MSKYIGGTAFYFQWTANGGTATLQAQYTKLDFNWAGDQTEVSSGSATAKQYLPTLTDSTFSYEGYDNGKDTPLGTADLFLLEPNTVGTITWGQLGTASGNPKGQVNAIVKAQNRSFPYADKVTVKLDFQGSGTLLADPNKATW